MKTAKELSRETGLGKQMDIKELDGSDGKNVNAYLGKYISKNFNANAENMDDVARWHLINGWYSQHNIRRFSGSQIKIPYEYKDRIWQYMKNVLNQKELTVKDIYDWALANVKIIHHNQQRNKIRDAIIRNSRILNNPQNPKLVITKEKSDVLFEPEKQILLAKQIWENQTENQIATLIYDNRDFEIQIDNIIPTEIIDDNEDLPYLKRKRLEFEAETLDYINSKCRLANQCQVVNEWEKYIDSHKPPI